MLRRLAAVLLAGISGLSAQAEPVAGSPLLKDAMDTFYVVVATDAATGNPLTETRRDADGTNQRQVVVAFIEASDAAVAVVAAGVGDTSEGRLINGADLIAATGGDISWRASDESASITNRPNSQPPTFYIANEAGQPLTQEVDGKPRIVMYLDPESADEIRVASEAQLATAGQPIKLSVIAADFIGLVNGVQEGSAPEVVFASAKSVTHWAAQWEKGDRLIKDYETETGEMIDARVTGISE